MKKAPSEATVIVEEILPRGELFHDPSGNAYLADGMDIHAIGSRSFRDLVSRAMFTGHRTAPSQTAISNASDTLAAIARHEGREESVFVRVGSHDGVLYVDLADPERRVVEIASSGWRIIHEPPVRFLRPPGMLPLPEPIPGGSIDRLREFVNVEDPDAFKLIVGFVVSVYHPTGPYALLALSGEPGAGKSQAAGLLRSLIDPNTVPLRMLSNDERDLMIAARRGRLQVFDNVSHIPPETSDALCRLLTGGGLSTRRLFTDEDEVLLDARCPVIVTSIPEVTTAGDLADRTISVTLSAIDDEDRLPEDDLLAAANVARPEIMCAVFDAVASALGGVQDLELDALPRIADLARWITAAEPGLGWAPGSFVEAYEANRLESGAISIESSPIGRYVLDVARFGFSGTAQDLLDRLAALATPELTRSRWWPQSPRGLSGSLRRLGPALRRAGISIDFERRGHKWERVITLGTSDDRVPEIPEGPNILTLPIAEPGTVSEIVEAVVSEHWDPQAPTERLVHLVVERSGGNRFLAAKALTQLGVPAPSRGSWTAHKIGQTLGDWERGGS